MVPHCILLLAMQCHLMAPECHLCCLSQTHLAVMLLLPAGQLATHPIQLLSLLLRELLQLLPVLLVPLPPLIQRIASQQWHTYSASACCLWLSYLQLRSCRGSLRLHSMSGEWPQVIPCLMTSLSLMQVQWSDRNSFGVSSAGPVCLGWRRRCFPQSSITCSSASSSSAGIWLVVCLVPLFSIIGTQ